MRITVICSDYGAALHVDGPVETTTRTFDMPKEVAEYIRSLKQPKTYNTLTLAIDDSDEPKP